MFLPFLVCFVFALLLLQIYHGHLVACLLHSFKTLGDLIFNLLKKKMIETGDQMKHCGMSLTMLKSNKKV